MSSAATVLPQGAGYGVVVGVGTFSRLPKINGQCQQMTNMIYRLLLCLRHDGSVVPTEPVYQVLDQAI